MDLYKASAGTGFLTHLTADAEKTLCNRVVTDLPDKARTYCDDCILAEHTMSKSN